MAIHKTFRHFKSKRFYRTLEILRHGLKVRLVGRWASVRYQISIDQTAVKRPTRWPKIFIGRRETNNQPNLFDKHVKISVNVKQSGSYFDVAVATRFFLIDFTIIRTDDMRM